MTGILPITTAEVVSEEVYTYKRIVKKLPLVQMIYLIRVCANPARDAC